MLQNLNSGETEPEKASFELKYRLWFICTDYRLSGETQMAFSQSLTSTTSSSQPGSLGFSFASPPSSCVQFLNKLCPFSRPHRIGWLPELERSVTRQDAPRLPSTSPVCILALVLCSVVGLNLRATSPCSVFWVIYSFTVLWFLQFWLMKTFAQ